MPQLKRVVFVTEYRGASVPPLTSTTDTSLDTRESSGDLYGHDAGQAGQQQRTRQRQFGEGTQKPTLSSLGKHSMVILVNKTSYCPSRFASCKPYIQNHMNRIASRIFACDKA